MVQITDTAAQALEQALTQQGSPPDQAFRLADGGNGQIALEQGTKEPGDIELNSNNNRAVLFVASEVAPTLEDQTVDVIPSPDGLRLTVRPS